MLNPAKPDLHYISGGQLRSPCGTQRLIEHSSSFASDVERNVLYCAKVHLFRSMSTNAVHATGSDRMQDPMYTIEQICQRSQQRIARLHLYGGNDSDN